MNTRNRSTKQKENNVQLLLTQADLAKALSHTACVSSQTSVSAPSARYFSRTGDAAGALSSVGRILYTPFPTPSWTTDDSAITTPAGISTPGEAVGLEGGYFALVARNKPLSPASSTVVEKDMMIGKIVYLATVAGMAYNPEAEANNRARTPVCTSPGYLWMNVTVGYSLASASKARVVCVVPFSAPLMNVKLFFTSRSVRSIALS